MSHAQLVPFSRTKIQRGSWVHATGLGSPKGHKCQKLLGVCLEMEYQQRKDLGRCVLIAFGYKLVFCVMTAGVDKGLKGLWLEEGELEICFEFLNVVDRKNGRDIICQDLFHDQS